ncbi:hypothetical protein EMIT07CA2_70218 [Brevibacillus sp. IT-7CA2]
MVSREEIAWTRSNPLEVAPFFHNQGVRFGFALLFVIVGEFKGDTGRV